MSIEQQYADRKKGRHWSPRRGTEGYRYSYRNLEFWNFLFSVHFGIEMGRANAA